MSDPQSSHFGTETSATNSHQPILQTPAAILSSTSLEDNSPEASGFASPVLVDAGSKQAKARSAQGSMRIILPQTMQQAFSWILKSDEKGQVRNKSTLIGVHVVMASSLVFIPVLIIRIFFNSLLEKHGGSFAYNSQIGDDSSEMPLDIARFFISAGAGWLGVIGSIMATNLVLKVMKHTERKDQSYPHAVLMLLEVLPALRPYLALSFGSIVLNVMAGWLYLRDVAPVLLATQMSQASKPEVADIQTRKILEVLESSIKSLLTPSIPKFRNVLLGINAFVFVASTLLFIEKAFVQLMAFNFRGSAAAARYRDNAFTLKALKRIYKNHLPEGEYSADLCAKFDAEKTAKVFASLLGYSLENLPEEIVMKMEAFRYDLVKQQAARFFSIMDIANNGNLTKEEFMNAVKAIITEKDTLINLMGDHNCIIGKIDEILMMVVFTADLVLGLTFVGVPIMDLIIALAAIIGLGYFLIEDVLKKAFTSFVFILITHPYDTGDRIDIDGTHYFVEEVGLWLSVMRGPGGTKTIFLNHTLADKSVANHRRTPRESELFRFKCHPSMVSSGNMAALKQDLLAFVQAHPRFYLPEIIFDDVDVLDAERAMIIVKIFHRQNFQNEEAQQMRSQSFALYLKEALEKNNIPLAKPMARAVIVEN